MLTEIKPDIFKINADSNIYIIKSKAVVIDTGFRAHRSLIESRLSKVIDPKKVKRVLFTHLHLDHIGNFDLFPNAEFYTSRQSIADLKLDRNGTILDPALSSIFNIELKPLPHKFTEGIEVIKTPGHTHGSTCFLYRGVLFSGDTLFADSHGRTDLPSSDPEVMKNSLAKLENLEYDILAPGHDY